jgi:hypothetical protein
MNATAKAIIERHQDDLDKYGTDKDFENILHDAIKENVLDEVLDIFYAADITIPPEVVTKQLYDFYITKIATSPEGRDKINYLINKNQIAIIKALDTIKNK